MVGAVSSFVKLVISKNSLFNHLVVQRLSRITTTLAITQNSCLGFLTGWYLRVSMPSCSQRLNLLDNFAFYSR